MDASQGSCGDLESGRVGPMSKMTKNLGPVESWIGRAGLTGSSLNEMAGVSSLQVIETEPEKSFQS